MFCGQSGLTTTKHLTVTMYSSHNHGCWTQPTAAVERPATSADLHWTGCRLGSVTHHCPRPGSCAGRCERHQRQPDPPRPTSPPPPPFLAIPLDSPCAGPDQIRSSIIVITGRDWSDLAGRRPRFRPREPPTQSRRPGGCHQAACLRPLARPYAVLHPCTPLRPPLPRSSTTPSSPRGEVSGGTVLPVIPPRLSPPPLQVGPARSARGSVPARPPNQAWCLCR